MRTPISVVLSIFLLAGCGGGDGGGGGPAGGPPTPFVLGTATLPGAVLVVSKTSGIVGAGATITVRAACADPGIATAEMLVGTDWAATTAASVVAAGTGIWDASVTLPSPLPPGSAIMVRLTFTDGNVVESSRDAFPL